jgi:hypothetical protein
MSLLTSVADHNDVCPDLTLQIAPIRSRILPNIKCVTSYENFFVRIILTILYNL